MPMLAIDGSERSSVSVNVMFLYEYISTSDQFNKSGFRGVSPMLPVFWTVN